MSAIIAIGLSIVSLLVSFASYRASQRSNEVFAQHESYSQNNLLLIQDEGFTEAYLAALDKPGEPVERVMAARIFYFLAMFFSHHEAISIARPARTGGPAASSDAAWDHTVTMLLKENQLFQLYWAINRLTFASEFRAQVDRCLEQREGRTIVVHYGQQDDHRSGLLRFCDALGKTRWPIDKQNEE